MTTWPPAHCASWPRPAARSRWRSSPGASWPTWSTRYAPVVADGPSRSAGTGAGRGAVRRRLRGLGDRRTGRRDGRAALPASLPGRSRGGRVPRAVRGGDGGVRQAARHPGAAAGYHRPRRRRLHHARNRPLARRRRDTQRAARPGTDDRYTESGGLFDMTTTAPSELEGLGSYKFGWADSDVAGESARRGLSEEVVRDISAKKNEPEWMLDLRLRGLRDVRPQAACPAGARTCPGSISTTSSTSSGRPRSRRPAGTSCPPISRTPTTGSASRRRRSSG